MIYVEAKPTAHIVNGETKYTYHNEEKVISLATIKQALHTNFEIMGLESTKRANELSLLLRSGAMPANISIIEERELVEKTRKNSEVFLSGLRNLLDHALVGEVRGVAFSPDGTRLVLRKAGFEPHDLWVFDIVRGTMTRLTFDESWEI